MTRELRTVILLCGVVSLAACPFSLHAQEEVQYKMEMGVAAGAGFGLTDINHRVYGNVSVSGGAVARFLLNPRMAIKTSLTYTGIKGNTDNVSDFYPAVTVGSVSPERLNYTFSGGVYDLSATYELNFLPYGYVRGFEGHKRITPYIQLGLGFTYASSGTFTVNLPVGFGVKCKIARRLNLGLDWLIHFTPSDELDGLNAPTAIPSSGFRNKDHYSTTLVTLTYDLFPRCVNCNRD